MTHTTSGGKRPIATIAKGATQEIRVSLEEYKGHQLVDMRIYTPFTPAAVPMATKKGLACQVRYLPDLIAALSEAERVARAEGLLGEAA